MTMIVATMLGIVIATLKFDILSMLIFVGALWGSIVFPVIVSLYWDKVNAGPLTGQWASHFSAF